MTSVVRHPWLASVEALLRRIDYRLFLLGENQQEQLLGLIATDYPAQLSFLDFITEGAGYRLSPQRNGRLVVGYRNDDGVLVAACGYGQVVLPTVTTAEVGQLFGRVALRLNRRYSSIFGPRAAVTGIYDVLHQQPGYQPFAFRAHQPLLVADQPVPLAGHSTEPIRFQVGESRELAAVFPASVAMFTEELEMSPLRYGDQSYREHVRQLLTAGRTITGYAGDELVFKADLGIFLSAGSQISGVWVAPQWRGRGIGTAGMAHTVNYALEYSEHACLYVNDFNTAARRAYEKIGMRPHGSFATILYQ